MTKSEALYKLSETKRMAESNMCGIMPDLSGLMDAQFWKGVLSAMDEAIRVVEKIGDGK